MRHPCLVLAALLAACGGAAPAPSDPEPVAISAGGEQTEEEEAVHPIRTTTPVPVPQPAVAREEMSEPLQRFWTQIEETVAIRPPEGPEQATTEAVEAWAEGSFTEWIQQRHGSMNAAIATSEEVPAEPAHERAVAAALLGYALEDFVADMRGSPVPQDIAADPELLAIYVSSLQEMLRPLASEAVVAYAFCQRRFASLGDESPWLPWRAYCVQRGREMIEVFELAPEPNEGEPDEDEPQPEEEAAEPPGEPAS